jgi:hypothetical protein
VATPSGDGGIERAMRHAFSLKAKRAPEAATKKHRQLRESWFRSSS